MDRDPYGHGETVPLWVVWLIALVVVFALCFGAAFTARANPSSLPVFLGRGATPVVYRSKTTGSASTVTVPAGAAVGDIGVVVISTPRDLPTLTSGGGAWSSININGGGSNCGGSPCINSVLWKVLTLADLSGSWTLSISTTYTALDYIGNGATTLTNRETESNYVASSVSFTGYTPALSTRGALTAFFTSGGAAGTPPTGFTVRDTTAGGGPYNTPNLADLLNYQSGGFTWGGLGGTGGYGGLLEFSGP